MWVDKTLPFEQGTLIAGGIRSRIRKMYLYVASCSCRGVVRYSLGIADYTRSLTKVTRVSDAST